MYLLDVGVLVHAAVASAEFHPEAHRWLDERLAGRGHTVGLAWPALLAFADTVTDPAALDPPIAPHQAWEQVHRWLDAPAAWTPSPGAQHARLITELAQHAAVHDPWMLHLAALGLEHGLTVASPNPCYRQLIEVRWFNPLRPGRLG